MGSWTSKPLWREEPLVEGELKADAMRDPFSKEDPSEKPEPKGCCSCCFDEASCCRMFYFLCIMLATNVMFQATTQLPLDHLGFQMEGAIGCDITCQRVLGGFVYVLVMGLCAPFAGAFADRVGHRPRALAIALTTCSVFTGICSAAGGFGALIVPRLCSAIVNSLGAPLIFSLVLDRCHAVGHVHYGAAIGTLCLAYPLTDGLLVMLHWFGTWRTAFASVCVIGLTLALVLLTPLVGESARRVPKAAGMPPPPTGSGRFFWLGLPDWDDVLSVTKEMPSLLQSSRSLMLLLTSQAFLAFGTAAVNQGAPGYFVYEHQETSSAATADTAMNSLSIACFSFIAAIALLSDQFVRSTGTSRIWVYVGFIVLALIFFFPAVYVVTSVTKPGCVTWVILYHILTNTTVALNFQTLLDAVPPHATGRVIALHTLIVQTSATLGPILMDGCVDAKVFNQYSPYQAAIIFFGLLPQLIAIVTAVPAALMAASGREALDMLLGKDAD